MGWSRPSLGTLDAMKFSTFSGPTRSQPSASTTLGMATRDGLGPVGSAGGGVAGAGLGLGLGLAATGTGSVVVEAMLASKMVIAAMSGVVVMGNWLGSDSWGGLGS